MIVPIIRQNPSINTNYNTRNINFTATPTQILEKLEIANLCPGKKSFLASIAEFFITAQAKLVQEKEAPGCFIYRLGEKNNIPKSIAGLKIGDRTISQMDEFLNADGFKCSPTSTCACGLGSNKGQFAKKLLQMIGVENPENITISK